MLLFGNGFVACIPVWRSPFILELAGFKVQTTVSGGKSRPGQQPKVISAYFQQLCASPGLSLSRLEHVLLFSCCRLPFVGAQIVEACRYLTDVLQSLTGF
jgi:hypothetical protein